MEEHVLKHKEYYPLDKYKTEQTAWSSTKPRENGLWERFNHDNKSYSHVLTSSMCVFHRCFFGILYFCKFDGWGKLIKVIKKQSVQWKHEGLSKSLANQFHRHSLCQLVRTTVAICEEISSKSTFETELLPKEIMSGRRKKWTKIF